MPSAKSELHRLHPRAYADFAYAYPVLSRRSGGVSIGVNLNLDKACNFDCPYCQVDRKTPGREQRLDPDRIRGEVEALLSSAEAGVCRLPLFDRLPDAEKMLRDVALSGDGEPTMVPEFAEICALLREIQSRRGDAFKLVLITNASLFDRAKVMEGIDSLLAENGEVWAKLDAGTEGWYRRVNASRVPLDKIEGNLQTLGRRHPFKIQSFFCRIGGEGWDAAETGAWLDRLRRLRRGGARIGEVQLYTLARPPAEERIAAVDGAFLENLRREVEALGLPARIY
jgi:wyosine [tRNA(Phe)-imidazoG37] synthetase (radical SAM superfamily)